MLWLIYVQMDGWIVYNAADICPKAKSEKEYDVRKIMK
jgi:hypothetical protein